MKTRLHRARLALRDRVAPALGAPTPARASTCPDVLELFSRHLEGEISESTCREIEHHLEQCPACRKACSSLKKTLSLCSAHSSDVPEPVQETVRQALRRFFDQGC